MSTATLNQMNMTDLDGHAGSEHRTPMNDGHQPGTELTKGQPSLKTLPASAGERGVCSLSAAGARHLLHSSDYGEIRCLECEAQAEVLILRGQVTSWHQKQVAQETVRNVPGFIKILNFVEVVPRQSIGRRPGHSRKVAQ